MVILLRDLRAQAGLTQQQAAQRSGIGSKTISSFEDGDRIESIKVEQLRAICAAYSISLSHFFSLLEARGMELPRLGGFEEYRRAFERLITNAYLDGLTRTDLLEMLAAGAQVPPVGPRAARSARVGGYAPRGAA